jgi:hypothetical protein
MLRRTSLLPLLRELRRRDLPLRVVEDSSARRRVVEIHVEGDGDVVVTGVHGGEETAARTLATLARRGCREVLLATSDAIPCVEHLEEPRRAPRRRLAAAIPDAALREWTRAARDAGVRLAGVYPLLGSALAGVRVDAAQERPWLLLQVERRGSAILECVGASCRGVETLPHDAPSIARCLDLLGEACPIALLCGGGMDLSELGYGLVREGSTWIRLAGLAGRVDCGGQPASLAAAVGAARHALGLAPQDAVGCAPMLSVR